MASVKRISWESRKEWPLEGKRRKWDDIIKSGLTEQLTEWRGPEEVKSGDK